MVQFCCFIFVCFLCPSAYMAELKVGYTLWDPCIWIWNVLGLSIQQSGNHRALAPWKDAVQEVTPSGALSLCCGAGLSPRLCASLSLSNKGRMTISGCPGKRREQMSKNVRGKMGPTKAGVSSSQTLTQVPLSLFCLHSRNWGDSTEKWQRPWELGMWR